MQIDGFLTNPKKSASGLYQGRFTCQNVQWTGEGSEALATFTITAEELSGAADSNLLWTDQDVQRGIQPGIEPIPRRELSLLEGYPDSEKYIFDAAKADEIAEKLLHGDRLFLTPLVWNLRPGTFEAFWDQASSAIYIYSGKLFLPDSHHRQQGIVKAIHVYSEARASYPKFSPSKQFKIELYFLSREDEGNYFFDKNQLTRPTSKSKAYDLTTQDDLSLLAKRVIENSTSLNENVNRVTDRLTARNPQVITLSTLREMMKSVTTQDSLESSEIEGLAKTAGIFYDLLAEVRSELGKIEIRDRKRTRENSVVDAAVMMHGYAHLMKDFSVSILDLGFEKAKKQWRSKLRRLSSDARYTFERIWEGDFFAKVNPLWQRIGIVKPGKDGRSLTVLNTGATRSECGRVLRQVLNVEPQASDLAFLAAK